MCNQLQVILACRVKYLLSSSDADSCRATNVSVLILGSTFIVRMLQSAAPVLELTRWQGLSGGLQQLAFAAASEIVPKKHRGQTLAIMTLVSLPGSAFGAPIGERSSGSSGRSDYLLIAQNSIQHHHSRRLALDLLHCSHSQRPWLCTYLDMLLASRLPRPSSRGQK